jgi:two-component system chemotaxis response regulator CheY
LSGFAADLMITDLNMPGMDGITLIKKVKAMPAMRFKPVLMLTTESQQAKREEAKAAGATGWLVKPVQPNDLVGVVKQVLPGA